MVIAPEIMQNTISLNRCCRLTYVPQGRKIRLAILGKINHLKVQYSPCFVEGKVIRPVAEDGTVALTTVNAVVVIP